MDTISLPYQQSPNELSADAAYGSIGRRKRTSCRFCDVRWGALALSAVGNIAAAARATDALNRPTIQSCASALKCEMKLWPKAISREFRFHGPRGTTATLLAWADVSLVVAQRMPAHGPEADREHPHVAGHARYAGRHQSPGHSGARLDARPWQRPRALVPAAGATVPRSFGPTVAPRGDVPKIEAASRREMPRNSRPSDGRGDRIRTCDPLVPNQVLYQAEPLPDSVPSKRGERK